MVLTLGAGSVWTAGEELLRRRARVTRRGLPVGPPPEELMELPLDPGVEESPFLRPRRRTRVRPRRRGFTTRALLGAQVAAVALLAVAGAWTAWQRVFASDRLRVGRLEVRGSHFLSEGEVRELAGARGRREHPRPRHRGPQGAPALLAVGGGRDRDPRPARHRAGGDPRAGAARPRGARPPLPDGRGRRPHRHLRPAHRRLRPADRAGAARRRGGVAARPGPTGGGAPRRPRRARQRDLRGVRGALGRPARRAARGRARCSSSATRRTASGS